MKQLCYNILNNEPIITPDICSQSLQQLVSDLLIKDSHQRPGINSVLNRPVLRDRISIFLNASKQSREFSHTG